MRLYLIRHGETDYNRDRIIQGHSKVPLNKTGISQAGCLGVRLREAKLDQIYSSDLMRAAMTARILSVHTGTPMDFDPGFRERNPGDLTDKSHEEAIRFFNDPDFEPPNGETVKAFDARITAALWSLIQREAGRDRTIAVVSHGMVCGSFLRNHLDCPPEQQQGVQWRNTSVTIADYDGRWRVVTLCDSSHLDDLEEAADTKEAPTPNHMR